MFTQTAEHVINSTEEDRVFAAAADSGAVGGLTHTFYRYPARFSPQFARTAIQELTEPGDLVLDPFLGGGTTAVEATANGRRFTGADISELAHFIAAAKTNRLTPAERDWLSTKGLEWVRSVRVAPLPAIHSDRLPYFRNMNGSELWRIRNMVASALETIPRETKAIETFCRCALLRTFQWALDGRSRLPAVSEIRLKLVDGFREMILGAEKLEIELEKLGRYHAPQLFACPADSLPKEILERDGTVKLVVTSPPYPGVHVLYHRWAIRSRRETPIPFEIAGRNDGDGLAHYTMGDRKSHDRGRYYQEILNSFGAVASLCDTESRVVQIVGFSSPQVQLPKYLEAMESAGIRLSRDVEWRDVPGRRWWTRYRQNVATSQEAVLFHRLA